MMEDEGVRNSTYGRRPRRTKNLNDNLNLNYGWSKKF